MKGAIEQFLHEDEVNAFGLWAFGDSYDSYSKAAQYASAWNRLHKDLYHIDMHNPICEDIEIMCDLWREYS
jgi:hypothetical protein